jgi:putative membrane protein
MYWEYGWTGFFWMAFWMLIWGALLCLVVWAALLTISRRHPTPVQHEWRIQHEPSAAEIVNQRYARGELDADTYEAMRERIEATSPERITAGSLQPSLDAAADRAGSF